MLQNIMKAERQRTERESWKPKTYTSFRINVICNGLGHDRTINEAQEGDYGGRAEAEVLAIAKKFKSKGFEVQVYKIETAQTRLL